jgi:hypothetical protein
MRPELSWRVFSRSPHRNEEIAMSVIADYANLYETEIRLRRRGPLYLGVLAVWLMLFLARPRLALQIWREKH